jgi:hypothetical protein
LQYSGTFLNSLAYSQVLLIHNGLRDGNHLVAVRKVDGDALGQALGLGAIQASFPHAALQRTDHFRLR